MLIERDRAQLLLVDVQERLAPAMAEAAPMLANCALLLRAADRLAVPVLASEQYPNGLGPTVPELRRLVAEANRLPKTAFACSGDPELMGRLAAIGRDQVVLCGIEAHVCVLQTALGLAAAGLVPFVVADATASRRPASRELALARLRANGVEVVSTEMVLFEWMGRAGTPEFKELSPLLR